MNRTATFLWFARHEARLAWRDWLAMLLAGRPGRAPWVAAALVVFALFLHLVAYGVLAP